MQKSLAFENFFRCNTLYATDLRLFRNLSDTLIFTKTVCLLFRIALVYNVSFVVHSLVMRKKQ